MRLPVVAAVLCAALSLKSQSLSSDAEAGKALFDGRGACVTCHTLNGKGGSLGPELSEIGIHRTPASLRLALTDPSAEIFREYLTTVVTDRYGRTIEGLTLNEDDVSIQLRDPAAELHSLLKDDIKELRREQRSLMPSYAQRFTATELNHVVAYLRSLRGSVPMGPVSYARKLPSGPIAQDIDFLDRIDRPAEERPDTLIDALQIQPGSAIAEIGSGTGFFTWRLAKQAGPTGRVTAVDTQVAMLDRTKAAVAQHAAEYEVYYVLGREDDPMLPPNSTDLIFIANAYHEFSQPEAMLRALHVALRADGRLVVIEFSKEARTADVDDSAKMSLAELRQEIEPLGFNLEYVLDFLPLQHGLIFRKRLPRTARISVTPPQWNQ
jgi:putative heme-binding domain-containing protein